MKYILSGFIVIFTVLLFKVDLSAQQKPLPIGIVDAQVIIKEMPEAVEADKKIKGLMQKYQDTLMQFQADLEEKYKQYEKQKAMMPADQQQKEEESIKAMQAQAYQYRDEKLGQTGELAKLQEKLLEPIRDKIKKAIEKVAKEEKISIVFDKSSASLLYAEDKFDLTYKVLDRIKRGSEE